MWWLLVLMLANKEELFVDLKAGGRLVCTNHEMVSLRIQRGTGGKSRKQDCNPGLEEGRLWPVQGSDWKNPTGDSCGEQRDPRELIGFQISLPLSSVVVHPDKQENKQRW